MPRPHLASLLVLGGLLTAAGPAFSEESAPASPPVSPSTPSPQAAPPAASSQGGAPSTLPPVKVAPAPDKSTQAPKPPATKKAVARGPAPPAPPASARRLSGLRVQAPSQPSQAASVEPVAAAGEASGSGELPSRHDLSPAASAQPAATTTLDAKQVERTPIISYGDIFRPLPGIDVSNYGQGAVGYGISMRGFTDAEHGRDIAYFIGRRLHLHHHEVVRPLGKGFRRLLGQRAGAGQLWRPISYSKAM